MIYRFIQEQRGMDKEVEATTLSGFLCGFIPQFPTDAAKLKDLGHLPRPCVPCTQKIGVTELSAVVVQRSQSGPGLVGVPDKWLLRRGC